MAKLTSKNVKEKLAGQIGFNEDLTLIQEPIFAVWQENLPEGLTEDLVKAAHNYRKTFLDGYVQAAGDVIVNEVQKNEAIESLSAVLDTPDVNFEVHYTKPQNENPTLKDHEASWGFGYGVAKTAALEKTHRKALASRFLLEEDAE